MENKNENLDSKTEENPNEDLESLDADALKELVISGRADKLDLDGKNKQLFERAKTAEGFEKQEDGSWAKTEKAPVEKKPKVKKTEEKSDEFGLLQETFLRSGGVTEDDEIELAKRIQGETKMDWSELLKSKYFKSELEGLRQERKNTEATSNVRGSGGESNAKDKPEYWIAKGVPPTKEDIPDNKARRKINRAFLNANKPSGNLKFYND